MGKKKTLTVLQYDLPIEIEEQEDGGYVARCSVWEDCYAQGDSVGEAINEILYMATSLIELYEEEGLTVPLKLQETVEQPSTGMSFSFPLFVTARA